MDILKLLSSRKLNDPELYDIARENFKDKKFWSRALLAAKTFDRDPYDWNLGFLISRANPDILAPILSTHREALLESEGIPWGLGEIGSDRDEIVDFLFQVAERCEHFDAWWCAAEALEKLNAGEAVDIKKRTLVNPAYSDLNYCLDNLHERPSIIGVLKAADYDSMETTIIPRCREGLFSENRRVVQNSVWLLERMRISDPEILSDLIKIYDKAEDSSDTLRPRVVEALGQIAAPRTRTVLEDAVLNAKYYRTRAYAAFGLGKIGSLKSLPILKRALSEESESLVIPSICSAIYSIEDPQIRRIREVENKYRWPENGMISDDTNKWYVNPDIYDEFAEAEDPLNLSLDFAANLLGDSSKVVDLGCGTGRFILHLAEKLESVTELHGVELSDEMASFLERKKRMTCAQSELVKIHNCGMSKMPFTDAYFDAAVSAWAFPSKMWDLETCLADLKEVRRVLKSGGKLVTIGWDETYNDQLSELWYRFVPEPEFIRETFAQWRRRRASKVTSPRNCHLSFVKRNFKVPLLFKDPEAAAKVIGFLFGYSAGKWVGEQQRTEFSISIGITCDDTDSLDEAIAKLSEKVLD